MKLFNKFVAVFISLMLLTTILSPIQSHSQSNTIEHDEIDNEASTRIDDPAEVDEILDVSAEDEDIESEPKALDDFLPLTLGDTNESLLAIKQQLNHVMNTTILVTDYFGSFTKTNVERFQAYAGLTVSGELDETTINTLDLYNAALGEGDRDERIVTHKKQLNQLGYGSILVTDFFGSYMKNRVVAFQKDHELIENGLLDPPTINQLESLIGKTYQLGDKNEEIQTYRTMLTELGFSNQPQGQVLDENLVIAVRDFQKAVNIQQTGMLDFNTRSLLDELNHGFKVGNQHDVIITIKRILNKYGYGRIRETDLLGSYMAQQLTLFQENAGIKSTGKLDLVTARHLFHLEMGLSEGSRDPMLETVKKQLNALGFSGILVTDYFGSFTTRQLKNFQEYYRLPVTGTLNESTIWRLEVEIDRTYKKGQRNHGVIPYKEKLNRLGFGPITVTDYFGNYMEIQVKSAQRYYGINQTGILDRSTKERIIKEAQSLSQGDRSEDLKLYKKQLNDLGYGNITLTNYFGSFTTRRLREFQQDQGLRVNGRFDSVTIDRLAKETNKIFRQGDSSPQIKTIKENLDRVGFGGIRLSNTFGSYMATQVRAFQSHYNLPVTGNVDNLTLRTLNEAVSNKIPRSPNKVVNGHQTYSYQTMVSDIKRLEFLYPNLVSTEVIGYSVDGRKLYAIKLGTGSKEVFINGSFHAREHMTTNVVMKMLDDYAHSYVSQKAYHGYNTRQILDQVSIWFVPMVNPDGVMLVQEGASSAKRPNEVIRLNGGSTNFNRWKANIKGIDLNRQYPYRWNTIINNPGTPSYHNYKGRQPLEANEARAVFDFVNRRNFRAALAYHSSGEVIYTRYGYNRHNKIATEGVGKITGYQPINLQYSMSGGGFTDWFVSQKGPIGMTMEIAPFVVERPVPLSRWPRVWKDNQRVGLYVADYVRRNNP